MQFGVFEKFTSDYLFLIAQEKSCDYLLIIYMKNFKYGKAEEMNAYYAIREKLRHQMCHPGCTLDLKAKDLAMNIQPISNSFWLTIFALLGQLNFKK